MMPVFIGFIFNEFRWKSSETFSDVCTIRLDFDNLVLSDPTDETAAGNDGGQCNTDALSFSTSPGNPYPTICGVNTGYHGEKILLSESIIVDGGAWVWMFVGVCGCMCVLLCVDEWGYLLMWVDVRMCVWMNVDVPGCVWVCV